MGEKYIIELEDKPFHKEDGDFLYRVKGFNSLVFDMTGIGKLIPYTEPDLEQVREDAFKNGYDAACKDIDIKSKINAAYRKGMEDAWDAARTLWNTPNRKEIFGHTTFNTVLTTLTAQETIEKIRQYEQEKEEELGIQRYFKKGEEVIDADGTKAVVLDVSEDNYCQVYTENGCIYNWHIHTYKFHKTGRHFTEIAEVIEKMREVAE